MKKLGILVFSLLLFSGCSFTDMMNTPTKKVEEFLGKYQTMDSEVLSELDDVLSRTANLTEEQKTKYRDLMKRQYQNLMYKVKEETVDGNNAKVDIEIEVYDYAKVLQEANAYLEEHEDEFVTNNVFDDVKFMDYKIDEMKKTMDKVKYTLNFTLEKENDKWKLSDITDSMREKIHGIYES